jgi:hypothetical protein
MLWFILGCIAGGIVVGAVLYWAIAYGIAKSLGW